jgi:hypothetical protein
MIARLYLLQQQLLDLIIETERVWCACTPCPELHMARYRMACLGRQRHQLLEDCLYSRAEADGGNPIRMSQIDNLRREGRVQFLASCNHISEWTAKSIEADWPGYVAAARSLTSSVRQRIEREREVFKAKP